MWRLIWANSRFSDSYVRLWDAVFAFGAGPVVVSHTLREWINEALMTVFFFVDGYVPHCQRDVADCPRARSARAHICVPFDIGRLEM